jgi:CubicO group peptidase (beta-lactamase class C family)
MSKTLSLFFFRFSATRDVLGLLFLLFAQSSLLGQQSAAGISTGLPPEVATAIEKRIDGEVAPSFAVAIIDSTGTHFYNFGKTTEDGAAVDEHSIYEIGSITKVFTATLLANEVVLGNLSLEDKISGFLPDSMAIPVMGEKEITLANLSDHTSGLPRMPSNFAPANPKNPFADYTVEQMFAFLASYTPVREVGSGYEYSNFAQGLLGHILAEQRGTTFEELVRETITNPLQMEETAIALTPQMETRLAPGHSNGEITDNWDIPTLAGAGALRSSTYDMARFIAANLGYLKSPLNGAFELAQQVRHDKAGPSRVGLGWHIKKGADGDVLWHNGGTGGYRAFAGFVKETGKGVVVLTNSAIGADDIGFHLLDTGSELLELNMKSEAVEVSGDILEKYTGVYEFQPGFTLTITQEGSQLFAQASGQDRFEIYAKNDSEFFFTVVQASLSFRSDEDMVNGLILYQGGREVPATKIK